MVFVNVVSLLDIGLIVLSVCDAWAVGDALGTALGLRSRQCGHQWAAFYSNQGQCGRGGLSNCLRRIHLHDSCL